MDKADLENRRKLASDQSLGSSHQLIYEKAERLLRGDMNSGSHLDFGSGQGTFLELLNRSAPHISLQGVDLMKRPQDLVKTIKWESADLNGSLPFADSQFTSISAIEIIEHLENPRHVFRELYRVLRPEGLLVLSTPNSESWRALVSFILRGHFVAFTDRSYPAHIVALNRKDLSRCASEAGFANAPKWAYSGFGCIPGLTSLTWQGLSLGALDGLRYCDNIFVSLRK